MAVIGQRHLLWVTGLFALGGLLVAATAPAVATSTLDPNVTNASPGNVTGAADQVGDDMSATDDDRDPSAPSSAETAVADGSSDTPDSTHPEKRSCTFAGNVTVAGTSLNTTASNVSVGGVTGTGPVSRILDDVPVDDATEPVPLDPVERTNVRDDRPGAETGTQRRADGTTGDQPGDDEAAATATVPTADGSSGGHARFGPVGSGAPGGDASGGPGGHATLGAGLAVVLVGVLGVKLPAGAGVALVESAGRRVGSVVRGDVVSLADRRIPVGPFGRYSRYDDSDPLENDTRAAIYESVRDAPGLYYARIAEETGVAEETVRYHGRILAEEGLVERRAVRGRQRLYPVEGVDDVHLAAALVEPAAADVLEAIERHEPATLSGLAEAVDRAPSTMSHHVDRLEADGLVTRERDGDAVQVRLQASVRSALDRTVTAD